MANTLLDWVISHPEELFGAVVFMLSMWKGRDYLRGKAKEKRVDTVLKLAHIAFRAVEEAKSVEGKLEPAAKVAMYLDKMASMVEALGQEPLSEAEVALAKAAADSMHLDSRVGSTLPY